VKKAFMVINPVAGQKKIKPALADVIGKFNQNGYCTEVYITQKSVAVEDYAAKPANTPYTTWLNVDTGLTPVVFSRDTIPVWSNRP